MTPYFSALNAEDYRLFRDRLAEDATALRARADRLAALSPDAHDAWVSVLVALEDAYARYRHLSSYLGCMASADTKDEDIQREAAGIALLGASLEKAYIAARTALRDAGDEEVGELVAREELAPVRHALSRLRDHARTSMAVELEDLAADLAVTGISAWARLYARISGNLCFDLKHPDGEVATLPVAMTRSLLEDPDSRVRKAAFDGANIAWDSVAEVVAACLNAIAGTRLSLYARRDIDHFLQPALFDAGIERATLDAMREAVAARQEIPRKYLRRKAALLGCDRLGFQDLLAPLPGGDSERVPWTVACQRVLSAFGDSYPALRDLAQRALEDRWIDYEPRPAKRPGGFCSSSPIIGQSRIFMTYNGAIGDMQTLAHELGHAFHGWVMRDLRPWSRNYPMTLAETASTFAEKLVTDAILNDDNATAIMKARILDRRMQDAAAFLLNIPSRYDFEYALYERRADGELSVSELNQLMEEAQRENYGDALASDDLDPYFWASKLHFYITEVSFYNFPYTFGYLFSMNIFSRAKREGPEFLSTYEKLLRATGSDTPENIAAEFLGVDLRAPEFWLDTIDLIEHDMARFEEAAAAIS